MHSYRALVSVARRNNFFQNRSGTRAGGWAKGMQLKVLEPEDGLPARETRALPYVSSMH